jgi:hypothetical protein
MTAAGFADRSGREPNPTAPAAEPCRPGSFTQSGSPAGSSQARPGLPEKGGHLRWITALAFTVAVALLTVAVGVTLTRASTADRDLSPGQPSASAQAAPQAPPTT